MTLGGQRATSTPPLAAARRVPMARLVLVCGLAALSQALAGCVAYRPLPLPERPQLSGMVSGLTVDAVRPPLTPLRSIPINPADGLEPTELAVLAVLNSPDLAAKRAAAKVADAQVFAAGLLPDPQLSASVDKPISGPDTHTAHSLGAAMDLGALLARPQIRRAAKWNAKQADLSVLWAEWGVAQQARQLAETAMANERRAASLRDLLRLATNRSERSDQALRNRDATLQTAAADLAVQLDVQVQVATAQQDAGKARRDLNLLLNLEPGVMLPLVAGPDATPYDEAAIRAALDSLPARRPDLLALKAGYAAQDANLRKAILMQFPLTSLGVALATDTAGVVTRGLSGAFALPIFNGGRGEVRVQDATRAQLRAEYLARLDQAAAEVTSAQIELANARRQDQALRAEVPRLEARVRPAVAAYDRGDIDSQTYLTLSQAALSRRADLDNLELAARLAQISLESALFMPPVDAKASK